MRFVWGFFLLYCASGWALQLGEPVGDLTIASQDQSSQRFKEDLGSVIVFASWTNSCSRCQHMMSELELMYQAYKDQGLKIYGIALEGQTMEKRQHIKFPLLPDKSGELKAHLNMHRAPMVLMLNRHGQLEQRYTNYEVNDQFVYRQQLAKMLSAGEI